MTNREEIINSIKSYFESNEDAFNYCIEELDSYNGYLGDDRYYDMEELAEFYRDADPIELLNRAFYGHDEEEWNIKANGEKVYCSFNPNRYYFRYNGYGNLVSSNYKDYSDHIDNYAIEEMADNRAEISGIEQDVELCELFDKLEELESEAC